MAAAGAALRTAQLNLGYASVTAPISGRIGRALVTEGALVSQAEATQLALIQQIDPVYVNSTQAVADVARLREGSQRRLARHGSPICPPCASCSTTAASCRSAAGCCFPTCR